VSRDEVRALQQRKINRDVQSHAARKMRAAGRGGYLFHAPKPDQRKCVLRREKRFLTFAASAPETI
jgi:hypothetical protein